MAKKEEGGQGEDAAHDQTGDLPGQDSRQRVPANVARIHCPSSKGGRHNRRLFSHLLAARLESRKRASRS